MAAISWCRCAIRATSFCHGRKQPSRQLRSGVYPRSAMNGSPPSWHQHFLALAHPGATLTRRCVRQMGKHSARAGRRAQCPRSHIGVIGITIRNTQPLVSPGGDRDARDLIVRSCCGSVATRRQGKSKPGIKDLLTPSCLHAAISGVERELVAPAFFYWYGEFGFALHVCGKGIDLPGIGQFIRDFFRFHHAVTEQFTARSAKQCPRGGSRNNFGLDPAQAYGCSSHRRPRSVQSLTAKPAMNALCPFGDSVQHRRR